MTTKQLMLLLILLISYHTAFPAKKRLATRISFSVQAPAKEIKGECSVAAVTIDEATGALQATIPVDSFVFRNTFTTEENNNLIRDRFRSYYLESPLYPSIIFKGQLVADSLGKYKKDGTYSIPLKGMLTLHGITQSVTTNATLHIFNGKRTLKATFVVEPVHYKIRLPAYIGNMYFKQVNIQVEAVMPAAR